MKNRITIWLCLLILIVSSCSKTKINNTPVDPNLKMSYYFNDTLITLSGNAFRNNGTSQYLYVEKGSEYVLVGADSGTVNHTTNSMAIYLVHDTLIGNSVYPTSDSLSLKTYNFSTKATSSFPAINFVRFNGLARMFKLLNPTDYFTLTISRYSNGTIDGTFSGVLGNTQNAAVTAVISNGQFSNVPLFK